MYTSGMRKKLAENLKRVQQRIHQSCAKTNRNPSSVTLIAVTKSASDEAIKNLVDLGVSDLGENRVPELCRRAEALRGGAGQASASEGAPRWHMVGHLQRNKVKSLLPWVEVIHSVDSLRLAEEIDLEGGKIGRRVQIFLEVNAGESQKHGIAFAAASHLAEQVCSLRHVELLGLMAMAPLTEDRQVIRQTFVRVQELFEEMLEQKVLYGPEFRHLSMGMSNDFELAIESGATHVRIGSALFEGIDFGANAYAVDFPSPQTLPEGRGG